MKRILFVISLISIAVSTMAQVGVEAKIDSIQILIGRQVHVTLTATTPTDATVVFPTFKPRHRLVPGVEVTECQRGTERRRLTKDSVCHVSTH